MRETAGSSYFPRWTERRPDAANPVVAADERLPWLETLAMGLQHVVAMFGATVLGPLLMGFDPNVALLMSGIGTLIFFVVVGGRVPSYLGSSFAFIGVVNTVTAYGGQGPNPRVADALGGIIACGGFYTAIGLIVMATGANWIETLMPPVVTGAVVIVIGLNLAPTAVKGATGSPFDACMALVTILCLAVIGAFGKGLLQRLLVLAGLIAASVIYAIVCNGLGWGPPIDFGNLTRASLLGVPHFTAPVFRADAISLIGPIAIILVAENLGHIKAVSAMTGRDLDRYLGRAFFGDGIATMVSGAVGGIGVTTYAENIGVMAVTRVYSTLVFLVAGLFVIGLGFSPWFGALIRTIPGPVLGGVSIVVFGLIAVAGARIWIVNQVDFSDNRNLIVAAATLALGAGDFTLHLGSFAMGGIGTSTFAAILLSLLFRRTGRASHPSGSSTGRD